MEFAKKIYLQLIDFNDCGECVHVEPIQKYDYNKFKKGLIENGGGCETVLFDSMNVKYDVILGDLQLTAHFDSVVPKDSKYCTIIYSFDVFALKKAVRDGLWSKAAPIMLTKHEYKY